MLCHYENPKALILENDNVCINSRNVRLGSSWDEDFLSRLVKHLTDVSVGLIG